MNPLIKRFLVGATLFTGYYSIAQESAASRRCVKGHRHYAAKATVASAAEDNYDVKYVKLNLSVTNTSTHIAGDVTTKAKVTAASLSSYVFELDTLLTIDSVLVNGASRSVTSSGSIRTVGLATALPHDAVFTAQVFYNGTPISGTSTGGINGINSITSPSWGNQATFTLSESYKAYEWWPCKQSLKDKIDSADIWLTVADSLKAGSNGVLAAITRIDSHHVRYEWKERIPIDYYLISLAVANYTEYSYYWHFSSSSDSMLIQNYVYNNSATLSYFRRVIDSTGMIIDYFSNLYGRYPFWKEKYGHCMAPLGGGMEHQTMTTLGFFAGWIIAHELGHQWFGDNVTCATWQDIFNNEAFASYSEYVFLDHFQGHAAAISDIQDRQVNVKSMPDGAVYVDDTTNEARIFDSRLSYDKGACVLHMLRFVVGNDSTYFRIWKAYQNQFKDSTATADEFKAVTQSFTGASAGSMNIDTFFNQWIYKEGFPLYSVRWNQVGSDIWIELNQTTSKPSSIALFRTPMEIKLHSASGDTIVNIFNDQPSQLYHFTWSKTMLSPTLDPNSWLLFQRRSVVHDPTLDVVQFNTANVHIWPDPATDFWQIDNLQKGSRVALADISGRICFEITTDDNSIKVPAAILAPGLYVLRVVSETGVKTFKVVKGN